MERLLDRYEVLGSLGSGGGADVLRVADHARGGAIVALKRARSPGGRQGLLDEVACLTEAQHPNLPAVYDFHPDVGDGCAAYTLEAIAGEPIDRFVARHGARVVPGLAVGIFRALESLHGRGFVHGDIHPNNVLVSENARGAPADDFLTLTAAARLIDVAPRSAAAFGALPFIAPERMDGGPSSPATDAFAVGVLLYRLLTGVLPYPDYPTVPAHGALEDESKLGSLADLVRGLIALRPESRLWRMGRALESLAAVVGVATPVYFPESVSLALRSAPLVGPAASPDGPLTTAWQSGVLVVHGSPGTGRSRIVEALHSRFLASPGTRSAFVRPSGVEAPGLLLEAAGVAPLSSAARRVPDRSGEDGGRAHAIEVRRAAESITALAASAPFALIVDDAERLPAFDLEVLLSVIRLVDAGSQATLHGDRRPSLPAVVIAGGTSLWETIRVEATAVSGFETQRMDVPTATAFIERAFGGRAPSPALIHALVASSGGVPATMADAVEAAFRAGWITIDEGGTRPISGAPDPLPLPTTTQEAAAVRMQGLRGLDAEIAAAVAAAPVAIPESVVVACACTHPEPAALAIQRLVRSGVLRRGLTGPVGKTETTLSFGSVALQGAAAGLPAPEGILRRLADLEDVGLSPAGRAVAAAAALEFDPSEARRVASAASELLSRGLARSALDLMRRIERSGAPVDMRLYGDALGQTGDDEGALAAYSRLAPKDAARARGALLVRRGRYRDAADVLEGLAREGSADGETYGWLARASLMLSRYDDAIRYCDEARRLTGRDSPKLAFVRGLVGFYRAEYPSALEAFAVAKAELEAQGELVERANVVNAMGLVFYRRAELEPALRHFEEALSLSAESGDAERAFLTLMNVAVIEQSRGNIGLAEARYTEALGKARLGGHRSGVMRVAQNLGNLYRYLGDHVEARRQIEASRRIAEAENNGYMVAFDDGLLGEVALLEGRVGEAERLIRAAVDGFRAVGSASELVDARCHLAEVLLARGDVEEAATEATEALRGASEPAMPVIQANARLVLAEAARRSLPPDLDAALAHATAAEGLFESLQSRPELRWQIPHALHRIRRDRGESSEALDVGLRALAALEGLAEALSDSRRELFLAARPRQEALADLRWLRTLAGRGGGGNSSRLQRLLDVNQRLSDEQDPARLIEYIIDSAIVLTAAERGFLLMRDAKAEDGLDVAVARNIDQENIRNKRHKVSYSIAERVFSTGEPVITTDAMGDDRYSQYLSIHHLKLRSVLCVPLRRSAPAGSAGGTGEIVGALYVDNRFQTHAFTPDDLVFMEAFAHQAAIALANARLLEERQRALDELARSQARVEELNQKLTVRLAEKEKALEETTEKLLVVQRRQVARSHGYDEIIGESTAIKAVFHVLDRLKESDVPVLVTGESGTGKELVARAIHTGSGRRDKTFIAINCSSIPETLIESELFGHVRGSFTGATGDKKGVFEAADKGTLFLDEIGEMPLEMQAKLLRALQSGEIQKVGSPRAVKVDVRIIAATNRNLRDMIRQKSFREDLFYRLAVVTLELPALRTRPEDIPLLVQHFIEKNRRDRLGKVEHMSADSLRLLMRYPWPGNVRELETVVKNASIFCDTDTLRPEDLSNFPNIVGAVNGAASPTPNTVRPLADLERDAIVYALEVFGGNKKKAAEELGIDRRTLYNKLSTYGIAVERRAHMLDRDD